MENIHKAMENLNRSVSEGDHLAVIPFAEFLQLLTRQPALAIRNVFQVFHDMIRTYVGEGTDEYPNDPESIRFVHYDCHGLFVEGADRPFFADRLFANRFIKRIESLRHGAQQNKIYIFEGPPGCGKSTFLNNILQKFEEFANTDAGLRYETVWRLNRKVLGSFVDTEAMPIIERFFDFIDQTKTEIPLPANAPQEPCRAEMDCVEVPCPGHDHPILMVPKELRRAFFDDIFKNDQFKWKLFTEKEYGWVFGDKPCTICTSLYEALLYKLGSPQKVFEMIYARPYRFNRRLGVGVSVFNPGDKPLRQYVQTNEMLQERLNVLFRDSNQVRYIFSQYARSNNGIYALMDIKSHNVERLMELHNVVSEGVHKVEDIEENVNSMFIALMNPEDKANVENLQSFSDRLEYIKILYVLDIDTEVEIYRNIFGRHIDSNFLPRVLHNFARVIISSRLNLKSDILTEWIPDPGRYRMYCDGNLHLLKMEAYRGHIPPWLSEEDRKRFTARIRRKLIAESETEGQQGFSGRDSIKIFSDFFNTFSKEDELIEMSKIKQFFTKLRKDLLAEIPEGFLDSLTRYYNYTVLQEVKESLYYFNRDQIAEDIQHYLFAINFEPDTVERCEFTGKKLEITETFFAGIEHRLLGPHTDEAARRRFRSETQNEYTARTLTQEMLVEGKSITQTALFKELFDRYTYNLKEKVLDPFLENENFRRAIKDFDQEKFKTYDQRIRNDVTFLIENLCRKFGYTKQGAREVCMYVIDNNLAAEFGDNGGG